MPNISPVYILTGDDSYLKKQFIEGLKSALLSKGSEAFNFNIFEIGKSPARDIIDTLLSSTFLDKKRLVIVRDIEMASDKEKDMIVRYTNNPAQSSCLIMDVSKKGMQSDLYKEARLNAEEKSFIVPKGERLSAFIKRECSLRKKSISYDALILLAETKGHDTEGLINEIEKLATYAGKRSSVTKEDVEKLSGGFVSANVFKLVDALGKKNAKEAILIGNNLLKNKKDAHEVMGMIGWHLRRLKKGSQLLESGKSLNEISKECKISPYYIERFFSEIKSFSRKELERHLTYLLLADKSIKNGSIKPENALEFLIVKICKEKPQKL